MYILLENRRVGVAGAGVNDENLATLQKEHNLKKIKLIPLMAKILHQLIG